MNAHAERAVELANQALDLPPSLGRVYVGAAQVFATLAALPQDAQEGAGRLIASPSVGWGDGGRVRPPESRVHDHGAEDGPGLSCAERLVKGQLRGRCLNDDGTSRHDREGND